jgi:hypothetical protein
MHVWLKEPSPRLFVAASLAPAPRPDSPLSRYCPVVVENTQIVSRVEGGCVCLQLSARIFPN